MAGLVPSIHVFLVASQRSKTWLPGTKTASCNYQRRRDDELAERWDREAAKGVFVRLEEAPGEINTDFIFTDKAALEAVHFRSFLHDCRMIERPFRELGDETSRERTAFADHLGAEHDRFLKELDPSVVKRRKRRNIIIHKDAADQLF